MSQLDQLIDRRRALAAQLAGVDIEICMALGDRDGAERAQREMYAQIEARKATAANAGCFFVEQGDSSHQQLKSA